MCQLTVLYYEDRNHFIDFETGELLFIYDVITPDDYFMFRYNWEKFDRFPWIEDRSIDVCIVVIPAGDIAEILHIPTINPDDAYTYFEEYMRQRMANVGG